MSYGQQRGHHGRGGGNRPHQASNLDLSKVVLKATADRPLDPELFSGIAERTAKTIGAEGNRAPKPSQVRKFFDELVMWEERTRQDESRFPEYLPFIRMLNAKAAYAEGRGHVTQDFVNLMNHGLRQVDSPDTLRNFKLFFEAFLGFYKLYGPKG